MNENIKWVNEKKIEKTINNLKKNNINGYYVKDNDELINIIKDIAKEGEVVSVGGSMSLFESKVIELLRSGRYEFLDRYKENLTQEDIKEIYRKSFFADTYFASANAITEDGEIFNVDGNGTRVAAILYGPDKVVLTVGVHTIVKNIEISDVDLSQMKNGKYHGQCDAEVISAEVEVTVDNNKIEKIELLNHKNERGKKAESIIDDVVKEQKITVDTVSGATNSSKVIIF